MITNPPQDKIVCVGDEVNITCGYNFSDPSLVPVWLINNQSYSISNFQNSSVFGVPMVSNTSHTVLTVYSANETMNNTTFQCEFTFQPAIASSIGMLTVMGKLSCIVVTRVHYIKRENSLFLYYELLVVIVC